MLLYKCRHKILFTLICLLWQIHSHAQIFWGKDSVRQIPIIQIGQGGYVGQHVIKPTSTDFTYNNANGYDHGLFIKLITNITKAWSISVDARITDKSCFVALQNEAFSESFNVQVSGLQVPLLLSYAFSNRKHQELFTLSAGLAFNRMKYDTKNSQFIAFIDSWTTGTGVDKIRNKDNTYYTYLFSLSKKIEFNKRNSMVIFNEWEYNPEIFVVSNLINLDFSKPSLRYNVPYIALSAKFGVYFTL